MSTIEEIDYTETDTDVALDEEGGRFTGRRDEWLKFTKGQILRASFVYFHRLDVNAVNRARALARRNKEEISPEALREVGKKAIQERAAALGKQVSALDLVDLLDTTDAKFKQFLYHYQDGLGYVTSKLGEKGHTKEGPEADKVWKSLEEPKQGFSTLLLLYPTNAKGDIDKSRVTTDWRIIPWKFSKKTWEDLWKQNIGLRENGLSLATQDLRLECKEAQYQQVTVSFVGKAIWQSNDKFRRVVLEAALPMYEKLLPYREMTTAQLREKLGMAGPSAVSDVSPGGIGGDFGDLLDRV